jgi:soluble lytic murein transglycosylase
VKKSVVSCGAIILMLALGVSAQRPDAQNDVGAIQSAALLLAPTNHPRIPGDLNLLWLAPSVRSIETLPSSREIATAIKLVDQGELAKALAMLSQPSVQDGPLAAYAAYYAGLAQQELKQHEQARKIFQDLLAHRPIGYLAEAAAIGEATSAEALDDFDDAVRTYAALAGSPTTAPDEVLMRLGRAARAADDLQKAAEAFGRVYFEFPLSDLAEEAGSIYSGLSNVQPIARDTQRYKLELGRADRLFGARQFTAARAGYERVKSAADDDDRGRILLRLAESDYHLKKYRVARDGVRPFLDKGSNRAEALYYNGLIVRALGDKVTYRKTMRRVADEFPTESWSDQALNELATDFIRNDDDETADAVFREIFKKNPRGAFSERAAWKVGWRAFRERQYRETVMYFERAAADFPRSDYRPAWLYWSGRAHDALNERSLADERFTLTTADYLNTYYGRLAVVRMNGRRAAPRVISPRTEPTPSLLPPPPNEGTIRALLEIGAFEPALNEVRYAERAWGDSPALRATEAWIFLQLGRSESGTKRFNLIRGSMTAMKRAYPQYMAAGGEELPRDVLSVIYPLDYWDLIQKYADQYQLDPYLIAALVAQESTFVRDIRSSANAYGLMQLVPTTARAYARKLNLRYSTTMLTNAESNIKMGTLYLSDKIKEFGDVHLALASYNAGERAVRRWVAERPDVSEQDEFIDDIPYPETQNYVKKILGTAEDYRRLYRGETKTSH